MRLIAKHPGMSARTIVRGFILLALMLAAPGIRIHRMVSPRVLSVPSAVTPLAIDVAQKRPLNAPPRYACDLSRWRSQPRPVLHWPKIPSGPIWTEAADT